MQSNARIATTLGPARSPSQPSSIGGEATRGSLPATTRGFRGGEAVLRSPHPSAICPGHAHGAAVLERGDDDGTYVRTAPAILVVLESRLHAGRLRLGSRS